MLVLALQYGVSVMRVSKIISVSLGRSTREVPCRKRSAADTLKSKAVVNSALRVQPWRPLIPCNFQLGKNKVFQSMSNAVSMSKA